MLKSTPKKERYSIEATHIYDPNPKIKFAPNLENFTF